jgi:hypothetical protein
MVASEQITGYLKWSDTVIGEIINQREVRFLPYTAAPASKKTIDLFLKGADKWNEEQYTNFLTDRIVSRSRRDIEKILYRLGLISYDAIKIAEKTYALNPKDLFWVSPSKDTQMESALKDTFKRIFKMKLDKDGGTEQSPDGQNEKDYGVHSGQYGIFKKRLSNVTTDAESEVAVYKLSQLLGVPVCPAWFVDEDTIFSQFLYNFTSEYLVHARHFFEDGERTDELYLDLIIKCPAFKESIAKMCLLDFITRQDDRHLSNFAVLLSGETERFYPLYDNGRSLFFDCGEQLVSKCLADVALYSTSFGEVGTYYDVAEQIAKEYRISDLINLNISEAEVYEALHSSKFTGYRLEGSLKWIMLTMGRLRKL